MHTKSPLKCHLDIVHVTFRYPRQASGGLRDISLAVGSGKHVVLLGTSGGGKTTLLRLIARLIRPQSGRVEVVGRVGFVQQDPADQVIGSSVWEDVCFGPLNLGFTPCEVQHRVRSVMQMTGVEHLASRSPAHLSSGELQQVALAGVLATEPDILLLDEPTAYLDAAAADRLASLIRELCSRGICVIQATHSLRACRQADHLVVLHQGGVLAMGEPAAILGNGVVLHQAGLMPVKAAKGAIHIPTPCSAPLRFNSRQIITHVRALQLPEPIPLYRSSCLAICGPVGSGKTTFALSCLGLDPSGLPIHSPSHANQLPADLRLAVLFQQPEQYFWGSTVEEELQAAPGRMKTTVKSPADALFVNILASLGLPRDVLQRRPDTLSDGEQRRAALAIALASHPDLLIADQPIAGLDIPARQRVDLALRNYVHNGGCLMLVTNERRHLHTLAEECVVLHKGDVIYQGSAENLAHNAALLQMAGLTAAEQVYSE